MKPSMEVLDDSLDAAFIALDELAWSDTTCGTTVVVESLSLALDSLRSDFKRWQDHSREQGFADEFSLKQATVDSLSDEWKMARVARLVTSAALAYLLQMGYPNHMPQGGQPTAVPGAPTSLDEFLASLGRTDHEHATE